MSAIYHQMQAKISSFDNTFVKCDMSAIYIYIYISPNAS